MKLYFLFFLLILNTASTFGQKQFEGIIIYKNVSKFDTSKNGIIKVFLKKNKMLVSNEFKRNEEPFYTLYDFEKGKNFVSIPSDSVVISTGLTKSPLKEIIDSSKNKEAILGYNCSSTSYKLYSNIESYICKIDAFFSDKLLFKVPNNMRFIAGSGIFFNDSSISLAAKISGFQTPGSVINNIEVAYKAITIQEKKLGDTLFEIPTYMKEISSTDYSNELLKKFKQIDENLGNTNEEVKVSIKKITDAVKQTTRANPKKSKKVLRSRIYE